MFPKYPYNQEIFKSQQKQPIQSIGVFWKVLFRWKGSVYKLLYFDLLIYMAAYYLVRVIYQFALDDEQKVYFRDIVKYCQSYSSFFPLSFVLGFFVTHIMTRWWVEGF